MIKGRQVDGLYRVGGRATGDRDLLADGESAARSGIRGVIWPAGTARIFAASATSACSVR